jgi:hypothetical protein
VCSLPIQGEHLIKANNAAVIGQIVSEMSDAEASSVVSALGAEFRRAVF